MAIILHRATCVCGLLGVHRIFVVTFHLRCWMQSRHWIAEGSVQAACACGHTAAVLVAVTDERELLEVVCHNDMFLGIGVSLYVGILVIDYIILPFSLIMHNQVEKTSATSPLPMKGTTSAHSQVSISHVHQHITTCTLIQAKP